MASSDRSLRRFLPSALFTAALIAPALLGVLLWRVVASPDAPRYAELWPAFTMTYTIELDPGFRYRDGGAWREVSSGRPDRIAFLLPESFPCRPDAGDHRDATPCAPGRNEALSEEYVEVDHRSLTPPYSGGIAVFAEKRLNGRPA